jgi:type II secretory pathway pseudopilin PulG
MPTGDAHEAPSREGGFTYLMLLWWVAISGIMLMALAHSWSMQARRDKEAELVFRGEQIKAAIEAYARVPVSENRSRLPRQLEDLLADRRSGRTVRHLRRAWCDPLTGAAWAFIRDEVEGIKGVHSAAQGAPLRAPPGVADYSAWRFEADLSAAAAPASSPPPSPHEGGGGFQDMEP